MHHGTVAVMLDVSGETLMRSTAPSIATFLGGNTPITEAIKVLPEVLGVRFRDKIDECAAHCYTRRKVDRHVDQIVEATKALLVQSCVNRFRE